MHFQTLISSAEGAKDGVAKFCFLVTAARTYLPGHGPGDDCHSDVSSVHNSDSEKSYLSIYTVSTLLRGLSKRLKELCITESKHFDVKTKN